MADDPTIRWHQATLSGISIDEPADAWHSGHVSDVVQLSDTPDGVVIATETGGVWAVVGSGNGLPLSDTWDTPDVEALAVGPDGPRHLFAGCSKRYSSAEDGAAGVLLETDPGATAALLSWSVVPGFPPDAGLVRRIVVLPARRTIVVACSASPNGTGGVFWAVVPASRLAPGDPPRAPYTWRAATFDVPCATGFWDVAVASRSGRTERARLEDPDDILVSAAGSGGGGLYTGRWVAGELAFERAQVAYDDGTDAGPVFFANCGTSSVSSCAGRPNVVWSCTAWPDGRLSSVQRSTDGGRNWTYCDALMVDATGPLDLLHLRAGDQGGDWNNRIAAHPGNVGMAALGWRAGPFLTLDSGATWRLVTDPVHSHSDLHALLFTQDVPDSIGSLLVGSDGGLLRVDLDRFLGLQPDAFSSAANRGLPTLQCYSGLIRQFYGSAGASAALPGVVATGLQDNGNVTCTLQPLTPWRKVDGGDGGWNAVLADGALVRNVMGTAVADAAGTVPVTRPAPDPGGVVGPVGEPVLVPTRRNADGSLMLAVVATGVAVYGLFGDGATPPVHTLELLGTLPAGQSATALGSVLGFQVLVGTQSGKLYVVDPAAGTVTEQTVTLPKTGPGRVMAGGAVVRVVGFSDGTQLVVLVGAVETRTGPVGPLPPLPLPVPPTTYVLASDGTSWSPTLGLGLPNEPVYGCTTVEAPGTRLARGVLLALDSTAYVSRDDGQTWQRAGEGLPARPHCADLRYAAHPADIGGTILLTTYGRSLWRADLG
ncbi:hypothetical protein [Kineococcus rhizosphaerae]|uniref:BNR/Asp-box repeat protein n=1 Tax=Kineococcus rhizosphaerae TaxID=559628 RepID=A0A2T0R4L4_9ACTN|nr:hypothetical protein [Kineococcus rhizosphaerae]PRY15301.1 hypothetical protein CLV37_105229 [Kineococcus rhizosphaerae]